MSLTESSECPPAVTADTGAADNKPKSKGGGAKGSLRWLPLVGTLSEEGGGVKGNSRWLPLVGALSEEGGDGAKGTARDGHPSSARHLRQVVVG